MNYSKLITCFTSEIRRSLAFIALDTGKEEIQYINERLNSLCIAFQKMLSKEEANEFVEFLKNFVFPNDLVRFKFKEITGPIEEYVIVAAEEFLNRYIKYHVND